MKTLVDHLSQYASYHRDPRNIVTHFIGIPMIVLAVTILLSRPGWEVAGIWLSPALLAAAASVWFYLRLDLRFGLVMGALLGLCLWARCWRCSLPGFGSVPGWARSCWAGSSSSSATITKAENQRLWTTSVA